MEFIWRVLDLGWVYYEDFLQMYFNSFFPQQIRKVEGQKDSEDYADFGYPAT